MRNKHREPRELTILKHAVLLSVYFLSVVLLVLSFFPKAAWAAAPVAPTNLTATMASSCQVNLSWQDNATTELNYYVERSPNGSGSWTVIATLGASVTSYQSIRLTQNTTYYYRVRCKDATTYSNYSNTANTITATLAAPTALSTTVTSSSAINLAWADNTAYETNYSIERSPDGTSSWTVIATVAANVTTKTNTGLTVGSAYYYRVRAYDGTNYSAYSNVVNQTIRTITASAGSNGAIAPSGTVAVADGSTKAFTMTPKTGYKIATVAVDGSSTATNPTYTFNNIISNHTISATFSVSTFTITASAGSNGKISPMGAVSVGQGATKTFTMTPNSGYYLSNLSVDGSSVATASTYTFTNVTANHMIAATFSASTYTITASAGTNGTISPVGAVSVITGATQTFTITPNTDYLVSDVLVDGVSKGTVTSYSFTNVTANHSITTSFADVTPPTGSVMINNGAVSTNSTTVNLTLSATDIGSGISQMQFSNDNITWSTPEAFATSKVWSLNAGDGTKTVYAKFKDNANNWSNSISSNTIILDTTPPLVSIISPAAGYTNNNTPLLTYAVSDGTVIVKLDGVIVSKVSGSNLDALLDGQHTIRVESTDAANNTGFAEVNVTVDTIAPAVTITSPTAGYINNKTPLLNYTVSDGTVVVMVDGTVVSTVSGTNLDALPDGPHTVRVASTDAANNSGYAEVTFTVDTTSPVVTINSPVAGPTNNNVLLLSYTVSDGTVVVKVDGIVVSKTSGNNLDSFPDGQHSIRVESTDAANNIGFTEVNITVDTIAPIVTITSPIAGISSNNNPLLTYTVSDGAVVVKVDEVVVNKVSGDSLDVLSIGTHTVRVESTDAANNTGFAEVTFIVDPVAPTIAASASNNGTISPSGIVSLTSGATAMFTITPTTGYHVSDVLVDGESVGAVNTYTFSNVTANHTITASFANTYTITAGATGNGAIWPTGSVSVNQGTNATFTITPNAAYHILFVNVDGVSVGAVNTYTFINVMANHTITAILLKNTYTISASADPNGAISPTGAISIGSGDSKVFTMVPNTGSLISDVLVDGASVGAVSSYMFTNVTANHTIATIFTVSRGNDDANIYCMGTGTYLVGPSSFTNGITVPSSNNIVLIASPENGATINDSKTIVKGAMDTTIAMNTVSVLVTNGTGSTSYLAQVNGKYFVAQVTIASGGNAITVTATDQNGGKHQVAIAVNGTGQPDFVSLQAAPKVGIPTLKQSGKTLLDVALMTSASLTTTIASYDWNFTGSGDSEQACFSHSNMAASYQQPGLYLTTVTITDAVGNIYKDTTIVNVVDRASTDAFYKQIWNSMKTKLASQDIEGALGYFSAQSIDRYREIFAALMPALPEMIQSMQDIQPVYVNENTAKYRIRKNEIYGGNPMTITYYIYFKRDESGLWTIDSF